MKRSPVMLATVAVLAAVNPLPAKAADAAFVVGVGTASFLEKGTEDDTGSEHLSWKRIEHRAARREAERAFRELVRAAAAGPLYSVGPVWYDDGPGHFSPAVLLTDGTTDNRAIPSLPVLRTMSSRAFEQLGPDDDAVAFLAGPGEVKGRDTWIRGRGGQAFPLNGLMDRLFSEAGSGARVLVARVYREDGAEGAATLLAADPRSAEQVRAWSTTAAERAVNGRPVPPAGRLLPGLSGMLAEASPKRLMRVRDALNGSAENAAGAVVFELGDTPDSRRQVVEAEIRLQEETAYETNVVRRAGPLFTIVEEEILRPVGTTTTFDADQLSTQLTSQNISSSSAQALVNAVRGRVSTSFAATHRVGVIDYELAFDREQSRLVIAYQD